MKNKIMFLFLGLFLISFGSAWSEDEFNNSLATENLTFIGDENFTRWLEVPENSFLTSATMNLSGYGNLIGNYTGESFSTIGICTSCITQNGTYIWVANCIGSVVNTYGITQNGTYIWITDDNANRVHKYWMNGTYTGDYFSTWVNGIAGNPYEITTDNTNIWVMSNYGVNVVVKYDMEGNYISYWNAGETGQSSTGITVNGIYIYISGSGSKVYKYYINGTYTDISWNILNGGGRGVDYDGINFWLTDSNTVYKYSEPMNNYSLNPYIQINDTKVWNHTGEFNTTAQTSNFAQTINDYIETATAVAGYYLIPNIFHSDTAGILEYLELVFNNEGFTENSQTYSSETAEGNIETFNINFSYDSNEYSTVEAKLIYNNTEYTGTKTSGTGNTVVYSADAIVPQISTDENKTFYWNILVGTTYQNSTSNNQTVYELSIDDCSAHSVLILNMSLKDEELAILVNGSNGANVEIDLILTVPGNPDATQYYYKKWTDENNPQVCITTDELNYTIDYTIGFDSTDRVWEFLYLDGGILDSTKIFDDYTNYNINLMDLKTTDSTSFLFNYFDVDGLAVDGSMVHVFRKYIGQGEFLEVERSKADQNGDTVVHLVEEDVIYYFVITNNGETLYTTSTNTILCQAVPCTIEIEASGVSAEFDTDWDLVDGGAFSISSNTNTKTVSLTYSKNISAIWEMDLYKYEDDGSFTLLNSTTATGTSGTTSLSVPLSAGNVSFFVTVSVDDVYIKSEWVDFEDNTNDVFGTTLSLFLAGLIILSLGLMAISEGAGVLIWVMLGVFLSGALGLLTTSLSTGISIVTYLIVAGALLVWKIAGGRK